MQQGEPGADVGLDVGEAAHLAAGRIDLALPSGACVPDLHCAAIVDHGVAVAVRVHGVGCPGL
jgi:hypothetical protein